MTGFEDTAGLWNLDERARDDIVLPFQVEALGARGRIVRLGDVATDILSRHDYPAPVTRLLGEALALTAMLGAALKFEGKLILQTKTDGPVDLLVVDYETPGGLRGYAHYDKDRVAAMADEGDASPESLLGHGHLAMTIDQGADMERYQGVVPLEGTSLSEAAHTYFRQSEQIPTEVRLAVAPHYVQRDGSQHTGWRVGGLIVQHLPDDGGIRMADLPDGRNDAPEDDEDDRWTKARVLMRTVEDHELLDPMLSPERLLYRLYHEDGVRAFPPQDLVRQCRCSRERVETMLRQFSDDDRAYMVEDGRIRVTCEFCNASYAFDPAEVAGA